MTTPEINKLNADALEQIRKLYGKMVDIKVPTEITPEDCLKITIEAGCWIDWEEIGYDWVVQKGKYAGTFPKRFANWYRKTQGDKFPVDKLAVLGETFKRMCVEGQGFEGKIKIDHFFDWRGGEFNDSTCFWGENKHHRLAMMDNKHFNSVRLWKSNDDPIGRAWSYDSGDNIVIFNYYGHDFRLITLARIIAAVSNTNYSVVRDVGGDLWRNGDCFAFSSLLCPKEEQIASIEIYADVDSYEADEPWGHCSRCGDEIENEEDAYYNNDVDNYICESCMDSHAFSCYSCGDIHWRRNGYDAPEGTHSMLCSSCYNEKCVECYECGEILWNDDSVIEEGDYYCEDCHQEKFVVCEDCDETILRDNAIEMSGNYYCTECHEAKYTTCSTCGCSITKEETHALMCINCETSNDKHSLA